MSIVRYLLIVMLPLCILGCRGRKAVPAAVRADATVTISGALIAAENRDTLDLGIVREGERVRLDLLFRNGGDMPFVIENIDSGCGCALFGYSKEPVQPGKESRAELTFVSSGLYGEVTRFANIHTSLSPQPLTLVIEATVK